MKPAIFHKIKLEIIKDDIIKEVYPELHQTISLDERIPNRGNVEAACDDCGGNEWILYSAEMAIVRQTGKPYCECKNCGFLTHL